MYCIRGPRVERVCLAEFKRKREINSSICGENFRTYYDMKFRKQDENLDSDVLLMMCLYPS